MACIGLIAWGIIDSLLNYQPTVQQQPDESLIPDDLRGPQRPPPTSKPSPSAPERRSWQLVPTPLPGGAGVSLTWEY